MGKEILAISSGLGKPSSSRLLTDRLASSVETSFLAKNISVNVSVIELRDLAHDITDALLTGFAPARLRKILDRIHEADGLIAVTPVFTASLSGLFKSFLDILDKNSLAGVPVLLGATAGSPRHSLVLEHSIRPVFSYLRAIVAPTAVFAASPDWGSNTEIELISRIDRAASEFTTLINQLPKRKTGLGRPDEFDDFIPFETILNKKS